MNNKEILDNASDEATHWESNEYMMLGFTRLIADIKRIEELKKALEELLDAINDLDYYDPYLAVEERKARKALEDANEILKDAL
tara:strand:+ start:2434 stop:2685 length:252 start_codon:yes stop_codon:yes gene_type:complete